MSTTKKSLSKSEIDAIFDEIDFNFSEHQRPNVVNETCKPRVFKSKPPVFNLNIGRIKDDLKDGAEVEVRYGYFIGKKFVPGVPKEAFYNLLESLNQKVKDVKPVETVDYIVNQQGKSTVRIIEKKGKRQIETKTRLDHKDLPAWGFRIASAQEEPLSEIEKEKELDRYGDDMAGKVVRRKVRYTFPLEKRQWDLTIVTDPKSPHKDPIYEVEIEYTSSIKDFEKRVEKDFKNGLQLLYKTSKNNILSMRDLDILMDNFNNLFDSCNSKKVSGRFFEIENKPGAFKFSNVFGGSEYHVTPKLDGLRRRIFIDVNGIYIVNPGTRYAQQIAGPYAPTPETAIADTVMDTEYYDKSDDYVDEPKYFPFDVLIFDGVSYLNKPFSERISKARAVNLPIFDFSKPFFKNGVRYTEEGEGTFFDSYAACVEWQDENPQLVFDGQIAQAEDPPYKSFTTMKIKPPEELTVDLFTEIDDKGYVTLKSYTSMKKRDIQLGADPRGMKVEKFGTGPDAGKPIKWKQIRGSGPKKPKSGFIAEYHLLQDYPFVKFKGFRRDKVKPNFSTVVDSVRRSFYDDPITEEDLLGETLLPWRKWASANKRNEINIYIPEGSRILDIGVGRGGTLLAAAKRASQVYGIDPDKKNLQELWDRINTDVERGQRGGWDEFLMDRVDTKVAKGQDTEDIIKFIEDPVNAALSMFSLSFFFESEKDLDALVETIDQSVKNTTDQGGVVLVNFMDGERVGKELKDKGKLSTDLYTIKLGHKGKKDKNVIKDFKNSGDIFIGVPISIKFEKEKNPIFKYQEEWLAPYNIFLTKMKAKGFEPIKDLYLDENAILPESNKEFAKLNRTVVFKRGKLGGKGMQRQRVKYKEEKEEEFIKELQPGQIEEIKLPIDPLDGNVYLKDGVYIRRGVKWDESSFLRSYLSQAESEYRDSTVEEKEEMVTNLRKKLGDKLTKKVFGKLKAGNVQKRLAFDKLYTRVDDKIIGDQKVAVEAGYIEYTGRVANGPVGHEIAHVLSLLNKDVKIFIVDQTGKLLDSLGKGKEKIYIMKIGDYAYAPLEFKIDAGFKTPRTETAEVSEEVSESLSEDELDL